MRWYHWIFILGAATSSGLPPLAFLFVVGLVGSLVYDIAPDVIRSLPALPGRAYHSARALTLRESDKALPAPSPEMAALAADLQADDAPPHRPAAPRPAQQAQAATPRPRWLEAINDEPDQRPHTMILGPTRSGKTTLATAAMGDRGGRSIVITPKVNPSNWRGAEVVTLDDDGSYADIESALDDIETEKRERIKVLRTQGADALEPLTIVFDELGELAGHAPRAPQMMTELSSIGAELKMRVIGIGTSDEALGVKRWKATRNNYVRVEMDADRKATINDGVRTYRVQPRESVAIARAARLRPWRGEDPAPEPAPRRAAVAAEQRPAVVSVRVPERAAASPDALLAGLMAELPADIKAQVSAISPEREARLAEILKRQQSVSVEHGGGSVTVNVQQVSAPTPAPGRGRAAKSGGINAKDRRRRLEYIEAAKRGEKFDPTYKRLGGSRNEMHALFTANRAVLGHQDAK